MGATIVVFAVALRNKIHSDPHLVADNIRPMAPLGNWAQEATDVSRDVHFARTDRQESTEAAGPTSPHTSQEWQVCKLYA